MQNRKTIVSTIIMVLVIAILSIVLKPKHTESPATIDTASIDRSSLLMSLPNISLPEPSLALPTNSNLLADTAWDTFARYVEAAREHDINTIRSLSHQLSASCQDPVVEDECYIKMDGVVFYAKNLKRSQFTNIWSDSKQIILASDYKKLEDNELKTIGLARAVIYFTRDTSGDPKMLSFNDLDGIFLPLPEDETELAQIEIRLAPLVEDSDEDGLADTMENCSNSTCIGPNPKLRDTNGDGWWDGIEVFFY